MDWMDKVKTVSDLVKSRDFWTHRLAVASGAGAFYGSPALLIKLNYHDECSNWWLFHVLTMLTPHYVHFVILQ
jgi:hypothetical protein